MIRLEEWVDIVALHSEGAGPRPLAFVVRQVGGVDRPLFWAVSEATPTLPSGGYRSNRAERGAPPVPP